MFLYALALLVDEGIHEVNGNGQNREWREHIDGEHDIFPQHEEKTESDECHEIHQIHDRGAGIHPHTADIFSHSAHQVAGAMGAKKTSIQFLILGIDFVFLVELYVSAHDYDRLSHQEHEEAPEQSNRQQKKTTEHDQTGEGKVCRFDNTNEVGH